MEADDMSDHLSSRERAILKKMKKRPHIQPTSHAKGPWTMTGNNYPTHKDIKRGVIAAAPCEGGWMFWDLQLSPPSQFAVINFGSPPLYWAYADDISPEAWA